MEQSLPKHKKYETMYKKNETYWGIGVEHETYIETSKLKQITLQDLLEKRQKERYCVDYYSVYKKEELDKAICSLFNNENQEQIYIPILVNSHSFQKTDVNGEHETTFEKIPKPNQKFNGKTIFDWIKKENPELFEEEYEKSYIFDGDTVEFMTQKFYNAKVDDVMDELEKVEKAFIDGLNSLPRDGTIFKLYAPFKIAQKNYPFASYVTNIKNNAMFNNGTIHINITLPTKLDATGKIADFEDFKVKHCNYARAIQWLSPLLLAKYGAMDPLCESKTNGNMFAGGSQRVAVSRYIGLGTYDTDIMEPGKILTRPRKDLKNIEWYESFYKNAGYNFLEDLGMDINFNKHYSHGIEFRILEAIPSYLLRDLLKVFVYLADFSLEHQIINPKKCIIWHNIVEKSIRFGKGYNVSVKEQNEIYDIFGIQLYPKEPTNVLEVYKNITQGLSQKYKNGKCANSMISGNKYTENIEMENAVADINANKENEIKNETIYENMTAAEIYEPPQPPQVKLNRCFCF